MTCCPTPLIRITVDGTVEVSYDDGETWQPATQAEDPRKGAPVLPPLSGDNGDEKRCSAANNVLGQFKDGISTFEGYFDTSATLVGFVTAVAGFIAAMIFAPLAIPLLVSILIVLLSSVWNAGKAAYSAAFDDTVFGALLCILYCHCQPDGTFTADDLAAIRSDIADGFDDIPRDAFTALLNGVDVQGLNNLATIPTGSSASCDSCGCGTCDLTGWTLAYGDLVARDETHIQADAALQGDGFYYVVVYSDASDACCNIDVTGIVLLDQNLNYTRACGLDPSLIASNSDSMNVVDNSAPYTDIVAFLTRKATPFTVDILSV